MNFNQIKSFYTTTEQQFLLRPNFNFTMRLNEDSMYVPRFTIKNDSIFSDVPTNTPMKMSAQLIAKAIQYGMILQIDYKGEEDTNFSGHERVIYPMVLGQSADGKYLIRGYHLKGWSISNGGNIEKEWRMFRADRILNVVFTGAFFRLAPDGYNTSGDKAMSKIIAQANFDSIRALQQQLIQKNTIDLQDRVVLQKIKDIDVKDINHILKLFKPWDGNVLPKKDSSSLRITFAKPTIGTGQWIALVGTSIVPGNTFKVKSKGEELGLYKSVKWVMGDELDKLSSIEQQVEFKTLLFLKGR